jgi:putative ABC transport system permease protein
MLMAGGFAELLLIIFRKITGHPIIDSLLDDWRHGALLALFSLVIGLLAGIYPAFYLTRFKPISVLKGVTSISGNKLFRSGLVVFQFIIAASLIIGSMIVYQQMKFLQKSDKGFDQEGVLIVTNMQELDNQAEAFRQEIDRFPQVNSTSLNDRIPAGHTLWMSTYRTPEMDDAITIQTFPVDENYLPTLGFHLTAGRNFMGDAPTDSAAIIINQAAVGALGLTGENPLGTIVNDNLRIVGVVENFNFQSLREAIAPAVMTFAAKGSRLAIKLNGSQISDFLVELENTWNRFSPPEPIHYSFLDDNFARLAAKEKMLSQAVTLFTFMAILIACLGLLGLAAFTIQQRRKEIGVRIILGATISGIVNLLSRDFLKLVVFALLIASPVAYYFANRWLQDFAFHIKIHWWVFALTGIVLILAAFLIVSFQGLRAALSNPIDSLRNE